MVEEWGVGGVHTDVFVRQLVRETHTLGLVLHRLPVDDGVLELLENGAMDIVTLRIRKNGLQKRVMRRGCSGAQQQTTALQETGLPEPASRRLAFGPPWGGEETYEVFDGALGGSENDGRRVVGHPALGLRVDADELEFVPPATSVSGGFRTAHCAYILMRPLCEKRASHIWETRRDDGKTYMASMSSSTFHPCSELMGTALGIRYSRSSSSILIASILFST